MTENENFTNQPTPSIIDTEYRHCNFAQSAPTLDGSLRRGVRLFPGDSTPRTFIECNLCNCEPPPGSTVTRCNTCIKEFRVETTQDTIMIDGHPVVHQEYADFVYGRWTPTGYEDKPSPEQLDIEV